MYDSSMKTSKDLYKQMLGLGDDWEVSSVDLDLEQQKVEIHLSHQSKQGYCSECENLAKVYDYSAERKWRHLANCARYCGLLLGHEGSASTGR